METNKTSRKAVEEAVESHPQFRRVSDYLAEKYNLDKSETKRKFIDFLIKEGYYYKEGTHHNVLCFEFSIKDERFINRTKLSASVYPY